MLGSQNLPSKLQLAQVPAITNHKCNDAYGQGSITSSMICAGYDSGGKDACQGDSGGPFVCITKDKVPIITGIVSWGAGCGQAQYYGVYSRVTKIVNWIQDEMVNSAVCLSSNNQCALTLVLFIFTVTIIK